MTIDESVKQYEDDFHYMIYNKFDKDTVKMHYYSYRRHLDTYTILNKPEPTNDFQNITKQFMEYIR